MHGRSCKAVEGSGEFDERAEAENRLAMLEGKGGDLPLEQLEAQANANPNDPLALAALAAAYEKQGQPDQAAARPL